jgi:enterobacterial common antigen flippase
MTVATAGAALVQAKVLAVLVGPSGTGFYGLALALLTLLSTVGALGVSSALMKKVAELGGTEGERDTWRTGLLGIGTVLAVSAVLTVLMLVNYNAVTDLYLHGSSVSASDQRFIVVAVAIGVVPASLVPTIGGFLRGLRSLREYVIAGVIGALAPMVAVIVGALVYDARGAFVGFLVGEVMAAAAVLYFAIRVAKRRGIPFEIRADRDKLFAIERGLLVLGGFALLIGLAGSFAPAVVRGHIANVFDLRAVGFFTAAWAITNRIPSLIYQTFTAYLLPELSALRRDWPAIVKVQNDTCRISLLVVTPVLALTIAAGPWIVSVLLSDSFHPMVDLLRLMLVGELLSVIAWSGGSAFYPSGRPAAAASVEWLYWVMFVAGVFIAGGLHDLNAVGAAYAISYVFLVAVIYAWERWHHDFRWSRPNQGLMGLSLAVVGGAAAISMLTGVSTWLDVVLVAAALVIWAGVAVDRSEWVALRDSVVSRANRGGP